MQNIINALILNPNIWYIPIIIFTSLLFIGFIIGFMSGWKTSLYFLFLNILGFISSIFASKYILLTFKDKFIVFDFLNSYLFPLIILMYMISANFIFWIFYLIFFRRKLKIKSKNNYSRRELELNEQENNKSNFKTRIIGSGISLISVLPTTIIATGISTVVTSETCMLNLSNKFLNLITNSEKDIYSIKNKKTLKSLFLLYLEKKQIKSLFEKINNDLDSSKKIDLSNIKNYKEIKQNITKILQNPILIKSLNFKKILNNFDFNKIKTFNPEKYLEKLEKFNITKNISLILSAKLSDVIKDKEIVKKILSCFLTSFKCFNV